ncbi:formate dehydrogenase, alpha subunit [Verrucomicrobia bacterium]|nr:formate dehydrogenase, alpha subunit [Verrucomicrobiota bacterium]
MAHKLTTCTFCGAGCGLYLETADNRIVGVYPSASHPTNQGRICVRGWHAHEVASSPDRLKSPLLKKNGRLEEVTWSEAIGFIAGRLNEIRKRHGPDALAFLSSPRCSNEEAYLLQKLARAVFGTNNVDHGTGVYCNNSINVLLDMLGLPASTNSLGELAGSELILVDGIDLARQMPTVAGIVLRARINGAKVVIIDPRRHRLAESADIFIQLKPGTESVLYGAMAKIVVDRNLANLSFIRTQCRNYEGFHAKVEGYDLLEAAETCGVPPELIEAAALGYARARSAAVLYSTGIEARSAETLEAMINLVLLTGQIGKEGAGIFALTEHNNLQGACDMGMLPDRLPGYRAITDDDARAQVESAWEAPLPAKPGLTARSILHDRGQRKVRAIWLCRYDPVSTAFFGDAADSLQQCELVVVQHLFRTETAWYADVVLPTTAFGEEEVTFTSSDRRIQLAAQAIEPPSGTLPAWHQLAEIARASGADWDYTSAAEVMNEIGAVVPFYRGASFENLAQDYGRQWPCTKERPLGERFLFSGGNSQRPFKFAAVAKPTPSAVGSPDRPFTLVFGNSLYYWHRNVLIQHSETLKREYRILLLDYPEGFVEVNDGDAKRLGIRDGERIRLRANSGTAVAAARVTPEVRTGTVFVPYFVPQVQRAIRGSIENGIRTLAVQVEKEAA